MYGFPEEPRLARAERTGYAEQVPRIPRCPVCGEEVDTVFQTWDGTMAGCWSR